jgi:hypothetical protein
VAKPDRAGAPADIPEEAAKRFAALDELAKCLFWEFELLDPTGDFEIAEGAEKNWDKLNDIEKEFYVTALERTLLHRDLVIVALGERLPKDNDINGS